MSKKQNLIIRCKECGKDIITSKSRLKYKKYCSMECKILNPHIGWSKGLTAKDNSHILSGPKHPLWKGGITKINAKLRNSKDFIIWRIAVFQRDDYNCQKCGQHGGELEADHIKPWSLYPELRYAINNGRTLCKRCHREITNEFMKNNWKNQFFERGIQK